MDGMLTARKLRKEIEDAEKEAAKRQAALRREEAAVLNLARRISRLKGYLNGLEAVGDVLPGKTYGELEEIWQDYVVNGTWTLLREIRIRDEKSEKGYMALPVGEKVPAFNLGFAYNPLRKPIEEEIDAVAAALGM